MPNDCSLNEDQVYYQQLALPLLHSFHNTMKIGELGSVECGSYFLCRHEDRIMWIQVGENFIVCSHVIAFIVNEYHFNILYHILFHRTSVNNLLQFRI